MLSGYVSTVNMDSISGSFGQGLQQIEGDLQSMMNKIQHDPNPSQQDLMMLQSLTVKWQGLVQIETGILKLFGDTMSKVAMNIGS
jgi:hypothetical protein